MAYQDLAPPVPPQAVLPRDVVLNGPPTNRPADDPGTPPAQGLFYVPGEFVPRDGQVSWREGYWTREQPGWTWVPARWVRMSSGWTFVDGAWVRERGVSETVGVRHEAPVQQHEQQPVVIQESAPAVVRTSTWRRTPAGTRLAARRSRSANARRLPRAACTGHSCTGTTRREPAW